MKRHIENYIELVYKEVEENISKQFNIKQAQFNDYKTFDFINFYLIDNYVIRESKKDLFISIPEDNYRPNFFSSIFHSLVLIKLYQNFFNYENKKPILNKGDLIYKSNRVYEVVSRFDDSIRIKFKYPRKNEIWINT